MASSSITARNQATKPVTLLSAIDGNKDNLKILVRIFSLWKPCEANKAPFAIELVLSDTQGTKIGASLKRSLFYKFEKDLCEGVSYYMCNMGSEANKGLYRSTSHSRKLVFKRESSIKRVDGDMVPPSAYAFTEPSTIWQPTFDTSYLIDVIGVLTGASEQYPYKSKGVESVLCIIDLNNKGYKFQVTVFGALVDELQAFLISGKARNAVVIVTFAKLRNFNGKDVLQTSPHSSRLIFNPNLPAAVELKNSMPADSDSSNGILTPITIRSAKKPSMEEGFLTQSEPANIQQLKNLSQETTVVIYATVNNLMGDGEWWYLACKCSKKVYADEGMYFCEKCNRHVLAVTPRYLLRMRVVDDTDNTVFVLFDREAAMLLGRSCADLLETAEENENSEFPRPIADLFGKSFLFKVFTDGRREDRFEKTFRVRGVDSDEHVLRSFLEKSTKQLADTPNSVLNDVNSGIQTTKHVVEENNTDLLSVAKDLVEKFHGVGSDIIKEGKNNQVIDANNQALEALSKLLNSFLEKNTKPELIKPSNVSNDGNPVSEPTKQVVDDNNPDLQTGSKDLMIPEKNLNHSDKGIETNAQVSKDARTPDFQAVSKGAESDENKDGDSVEVIDLQSEDDPSPTNKRPCPFVNDAVEAGLPLLKKVKIEKE